MPQGQAFIKHEFDEAIAIQEAIVAAEQELSGTHPLPEVQQALKRMLKEDQQQLKQLQESGRPFDAKGEREEVAGSMASLMEETTSSAKGGEKSDAYEAHAVLLSLKRKQQDSSAAVVKIARAMKDNDLRDKAAEMQKANKAAAEELATSLSDFAVQIATEGQGASA